MQLCIAPGPRALTNQIYKRLEKKTSNILDTKNPLLEIVVPFPIYVLHVYYCIQIKTKYRLLTTATQKSTPSSTQKSTLLCIYDPGLEIKGGGQESPNTDSYRHTRFFISYIDVLWDISFVYMLYMCIPSSGHLDFPQQNLPLEPLVVTTWDGILEVPRFRAIIHPKFGKCPMDLSHVYTCVCINIYIYTFFNSI